MNNVIEIEKDSFPNKLRIIKKTPQKLYAIGNIKLIYDSAFAIVGTRKVSDYGIKICKYFAKEFALRKITTVSGMALGTDTIVHKETIRNNGKTIAVLGCGFNSIFPRENENLFFEIISTGGLVLSEYPVNTIANKKFFPERNRIISAISEGVLVIEAAYRSGTAITAKNATSQGKNVFAVPGRLDSAVGVGVNNLIKKGAILTTCVEDILRHYPQFLNKKRIKSHYNTIIKDKYKDIYEVLDNREMSIDEIVEKVKINLNDVLIMLAEMEIQNLICQNYCGKYRLIGKNEKDA